MHVICTYSKQIKIILLSNLCSFISSGPWSTWFICKAFCSGLRFRQTGLRPFQLLLLWSRKMIIDIFIEYNESNNMFEYFFFIRNRSNLDILHIKMCLGCTRKKALYFHFLRTRVFFFFLQLSNVKRVKFDPFLQYVRLKR